MMNVSAVVECRQVTDQSQPSDGPPAHVFDESIVDVCSGRDHHGSASELTIVESQKQAGTAVNLCPPIDAHREGPAAETSQRNENGGLITEFSPSAEMPRPQGSDVRGKPHGQQIDVVKNSFRVTQSQNVARF